MIYKEHLLFFDGVSNFISTKSWLQGQGGA